MNIELTALKFSQGKLLLLDQTRLPQEEHWLKIETTKDMVSAIQKLQVRGAPMIGVAASLMIAKLAIDKVSIAEILEDSQKLFEARPTAVNLMTCIKRLQKMIFEGTHRDQLIVEARKIASEDIELCDRIAKNGEPLINDGEGILTHCNTGSLATAGIGTAFGIIRKAHESGKKIHVYVDETRPLLQGGRLTAWECEKFGIPYTLICDNMAASLMAQGKIQKVFVGSDRIAMNGDFANKIGTYSVAVLANYHKIPFYVAAPYTTVDTECVSGEQIPIEQRHADEVRGATGVFGKITWAPLRSEVYNPSFDVTPFSLISGWVLDSALLGPAEIQASALKKQTR